MARTSKADKAPETAGGADRGLRAVHKAAGTFWRGGHEFSQEPRTIALADLTPEQADEIRQEGEKPGGWLVVTEVDLSTDPAAKA